MTNRSDRIKAHLAEAKAKTTVNEGADDHHLMMGSKLSHDIRSGAIGWAAKKLGIKEKPVVSIQDRVRAAEKRDAAKAAVKKATSKLATIKRRNMTEEAIKKAVKPAPKPVKILTNNPGYGYHNIAHTKHKGDVNKAHAEYNRMHAKVKDWAGEAGHLMHAKKPNLMVRDYLDSSRGRHLEGLQADEKYIKKDFGHFARSYDPKLFVESVELDEGRTGPTHAVFCVYHSGQYKGMVVHHGGNTSNPEKAQALADRLNASSDAFFAGKHVKEKANYHYEARPRGQRTWMEHAGDPGDDDHSGVYEVQQRDGRYKNVRIKRQPDGKYHIHHADGSKGSTDLNGVKSYISRNSAAWMNEETINETSRTEDAQRVQYGVMKRDDYLRKWKIGKFGEKKNSLAGPGGLYKNLLVGSNIDNKSAATKK
jgi:hypothetical protein